MKLHNNVTKHLRNTRMKGRPKYYTTMPEEMPLHFGTLELNGRHLLGDGEALHELAGYEHRTLEDGGTHDSTLV